MRYSGKPALTATFHVQNGHRFKRFVFCTVLVVSMCMLTIPCEVSGELLIQLTYQNLEYLVGGLQYSPEGSQIAVSYRRYQGDIGHIGLLDIQHGIPLEILYSNTPDSGVYSFCWEPDGMHFLLSMKTAYSNYCDLYRGYIYGGQLVNITNTPSRSEQYPMYSHDGNWLVYSIEEQGSMGLDIALLNVQTQWDSIIFTGPEDQKDYSWCANDTMFAYENPIVSLSGIYKYSIPEDTSIFWIPGEDPCL